MARLGAVDRPLAVLSLAGFISQVGVAVMLPLLPLYATLLGASPFVLGLLTSGFAVLNTIGQLGVGFLSDRFGARRMVPTGLGIYAAANALIATATSATPLVAFRSLAGFGGGMAIVAERVYLARSTPAHRLAFTNGILSAAQSAGTVTGPAVAGFLAAAADLRVPFVLVAVTSLVAFGGTLFLPREPAAASARATAIVPGDDAGVDAARAIPTANGQPPVRTALRPIVALLLANLALQAGFGAFITTYAPFSTTRLGWSTAEVGIVFSLFGAGSILLGPWLSRLADRHGRRLIAILGTVPVVAWGVILVMGLPSPVIWAESILAGGGLTAFGAAWYALLSEASPAGRQGRTFGFVSAISTLGIVVGAMAASTLWEAVDIAAGPLIASFAVAAAIPALLALPGARPSTAAA
jgi:MFS family permease